MATNTSRLGLLKKDTATDGNDTFNIKTMLNDNWDKIDAKVAVLGADGKVPADQVNIPALADASTTQKGVVQLEDSVTSTSTAKAATPNSVKTVNDAVVAHQADLVSHGIYGTATGTNTLVMTNSNVTSYVEGMLIAFKNTTANTDAVTLNINSLGAKPIKKANGNTLSGGNLKAGGMYQVRYDGANFILLGEGGEYGTATASQVLQGYTLGTESGVVPGAYVPDGVDSVQTGTFTMGSFITSKDVAINSVDLTKAIVLVSVNLPIDYINSAANEATVNAKFTSNTNIRFERYGDSGNIDVSWQVINFKNIKSLQSGTQSYNSNTEYQLTVAPVNISKSVLFTSFKIATTERYVYSALLKTRIIDSTHIGFMQPISATRIVSWFLVEFN